jgi:hypothetical protein
MLKTLGTLAIVTLTSLPAAALAQQPKDTQPPAKEPSAAAGQPGKPKEEPPAKPVTILEAAGQPLNVRVELTITDQRGDVTPVTKTVSMIASDRSWSRIRTQGDVRTPTGFRPVILNVDARPTLLVKDGNRARVELTIEYRPVAAEADTEKSTTPNINESLSVILEDGKPMLISQSADPVTDRKVKVEAKATVLR